MELMMKDKEQTAGKSLCAAVAGCLSIDICPQFVGSGRDFGEIIQEGKITRITGNDVFPGGSVANTGIAMKMFGVQPYLLGKVGEDGFGNLLMHMLCEEAGETAAGTLALTSDAATAYSLILAPQGLDRAILQNPGANDVFCIDDIPWKKLEGCRLMHFGHPPTIRHFYENNGEQLVQLFERAKAMDMVTSLDLCAVDPASDAGKVDWRKILSRVLPLVDFFLPSRDELSYMLGMSAMEGHGFSETLIAESVKLGAFNIVIKEGAEGMSYRNEDDFSMIERKLGFEPGSMADWEGREGHAKAIPAKKEVSGLGAGDTSIAAYLAAMMQGYSFDETLFLSRAEGSLCVGDASATGGLLPFSKVNV